MSRKGKVILAWIMLIAWMGFIFFMSAQPGDVSSSQSGFVLEVLRKIGIVVKDQYLDLVTLVIRKGAHVTEYFILGLLGYNVLRHYIETRKARFIALVIVIAYAASDEFHQTFVFGRAGAIRDVIIDTSGGIVAFIVIGLFNMKNKWLGDNIK